MKIAIAQLTASHDKQINLQHATNYIAKAKQNGAELVVLPEGFMAFLGNHPKLYHAQIAESLTGAFVTTLASLAKKYNVHLICGIYESIPNENKRAYNTVLLLDNQGKLLNSYRKTHLYDAFAYSESTNLLASDNPLICQQTELAKIGMLVCYELRFPEISRTLALQGAQILVVPTAWVKGPMKEEHLHCLAQARAIENNLFVCVANQVGNIYTGRSVIYDPMGVVVASAGAQESLLVADLDLKLIEQTRQQLPCLAQRQTMLYKL